MVTVEDVIGRLESRAANHNMDIGDLLEKIPAEVRDCHLETNEWLDQKQVSHYQPVSTHPHLENDPTNWDWEDPSPNMRRGDTPMTQAEIAANQLDKELDASLIDGDPFDTPDPEWVDVLVENDIPLDLPEEPTIQFW